MNLKRGRDFRFPKQSQVIIFYFKFWVEKEITTERNLFENLHRINSQAQPISELVLWGI